MSTSRLFSACRQSGSPDYGRQRMTRHCGPRPRSTCPKLGWPLHRPLALACSHRRSGDDYLGVHTGLQNISIDDLRAAWRRIEALGFDWISIWDHLYGATGKADDTNCLEAVTMHAALAIETSRVQCGSLRLLGRLPPPCSAGEGSDGDRLALRGGLRSASAPAGPRSSTTRSGSTSRAGRRLTSWKRRGLRPRVAARRRHVVRRPVVLADEARNEPRPVQAKLPIWIGGGGERRTLRIAARYADGWNVPFMSPETFARKRDILTSAAPTSAVTLRRSSVRSMSAWHGPRRAPRAVRGDQRLRPSGVCSAGRMPRSPTASAPTSPPGPIRSTRPARRIRSRRRRALRSHTSA